MNTNLAGTAQAYDATQVSSLGTMTTDATTMAFTTDALGVGIAGATNTLTVGAITNNVLESVSITTGANSNADISNGNITTTNTEFTTATVNAGANSILVVGEFVADSAAGAVTVDIDGGDGSSITIGNASSTFDAAAVTMDINLGDQATIVSGQAIVGNTITSNTVTVGAGVGAVSA